MKAFIIVAIYGKLTYKFLIQEQLGEKLSEEQAKRLAVAYFGENKETISIVSVSEATINNLLTYIKDLVEYHSHTTIKLTEGDKTTKKERVWLPSLVNESKRKVIFM